MTRLARRLHVGVLVVIATTLLACAAPEQPRRRAPTLVTGEHYWAYGIDLLADGHEDSARSMLEKALELDLEEPLYLRDLAELRLAAGDRPGAAEAARRGLRRLEQVPTTAQFRDADRAIFVALLEGLEAAATGDTLKLELLATTVRPALADPWFLLGWAFEERGDRDSARAAYRSYLDRSPELGLLRRSIAMRHHARAAFSTP
jgi:Flp pilus assembly protein TadD